MPYWCKYPRQNKNSSKLYFPNLRIHDSHCSSSSPPFCSITTNKISLFQKYVVNVVVVVVVVVAVAVVAAAAATAWSDNNSCSLLYNHFSLSMISLSRYYRGYCPPYFVYWPFTSPHPGPQLSK